jgi:hypothetical protein
MTDPKSPLRHKACFLCEMPLDRCRKGECGSMYSRQECWWVPILRDYPPSVALRMSREANLRYYAGRVP